MCHCNACTVPIHVCMCVSVCVCVCVCSSASLDSIAKAGCIGAHVPDDVDMVLLDPGVCVCVCVYVCAHQRAWLPLSVQHSCSRLHCIRSNLTFKYAG